MLITPKKWGVMQNGCQVIFFAAVYFRDPLAKRKTP